MNTQKENLVEAAVCGAVHVAAEKLIDGTEIGMECFKRGAQSAAADYAAIMAEGSVKNLLPISTQELADKGIKPALSAGIYIGINMASQWDYRTKTQMFIQQGVSSAVARYGAKSLSNMLLR